MADTRRKKLESEEIADFLAELADTGNVHLYGCRYAAATFEVGTADLIDKIENHVLRAWSEFNGYAS